MHGQWSSPAYGIFKRHSSGHLPAAATAALWLSDPPTGQLLWLFDCNPKDARHELGGRGTKSDFVGMPVVYKEKIYIGTGQDPEHLEGVGHFWCIDPTDKLGDISSELVTDDSKFATRTKPNPNSGAIWHYGGNDNAALFQAQTTCLAGR